MKRKLFIFALVLCSAIAFALFGATAEGMKENGTALKGAVADKSGQAVANAKVYLIPSADVEAMAKTPVEIKRDANNDEPHEDLLRLNGDRYQKAVTDQKGNFAISNVADGKYFVYAEPADKTYLPGGDISNKAMTAAELTARPVKILLSGNAPAGAAYIGTSKCLACHKQYESIKMTLHKMGIRAVGKDSGLQDTSRFPNFEKGLRKLMEGKKFYFYGFDKSRGFDKYMISDKAPADPATLSFTATFYTDKDGKLKFNTENMKDTSDPARTYTVDMTYGGGLFKQRYLVRVGKNLFPFVQFNQHGDDSYGDRSRKAWRDYHADWFFNEETKKLIDPPVAKSFEKECASCHYTGYTLTKTPEGAYIAGAVNDPNGEADIDGDGVPNELNIGCEVCHGPGSAHAAAPKDKKAATIVSPGKLAAERTSVICGQCHSRPQGNLKNDQPVDKDNKMMLPGTSRNDFLVNYTTREDAAKGDYWPDGIHSKSHHQQYTDFIKSKKYRNGNQIMKCSDCHDPHGKNGRVTHQMRDEYTDRWNTLCTNCHKDKGDIRKHMESKTGVADMGKINCVDCHNAKTMQTGAGFGKGLTKKDGKNYWVNDVTSHIFDVPKKDNIGVKGVEPGKAMPVPYTNICGSCHNTEGL